MDISFRILGSKALQDQIITDIEALYFMCRSENLIPMYLIVGPIFFSVSTIQYIKDNLQIQDWDYQVDTNYDALIKMYNELKLRLLTECEAKEGLFDLSDQISIFYQPDEEYLAVRAIDLEKYKKEKKVTERCLETLAYDYSDLLVDFNPENYSQ